MALPPGTYPVGGPIIGTAEKPAASRELFEAGAVWIGNGEVDVIHFTNGAYTWAPIGGADATRLKEELEAKIAQEAQTRVAADTALTQKGDAETTARVQAVAALNQRIDAIAASAGSLAKARNEDVDAETDDERYMTVAKTFRAIARKVKNASTTVRGVVLLARNEDVDATESDTSRVGTIAAIKRLLDRLRPVALQLPAPTNKAIDAGKGPVLNSSGRAYELGAAADFTPSKANLYDAVKAIFHPGTNAGVSADDGNNELDVSASGAATPLSDDKPTKPNDGVGTSGIAEKASRGDHKHPLPAHATRTSGGIMSAGDKQQVDKVADLEHRTVDLAVTTHDAWADLPNGNAAAFRMVGVNQAETLTSASWGHRHQALLSNTHYIVELRIPRADSLAQYRLSVDDALVAPILWSEGEPDATYRYFGGVGTIDVARNKFVEMQQSSRTYHTTYNGDVTEGLKGRAGITGNTADIRDNATHIRQLQEEVAAGTQLTPETLEALVQGLSTPQSGESESENGRMVLYEETRTTSGSTLSEATDANKITNVAGLTTLPLDRYDYLTYVGGVLSRHENFVLRGLVPDGSILTLSDNSSPLLTFPSINDGKFLGMFVNGTAVDNAIVLGYVNNKLFLARQRPNAETPITDVLPDITLTADVSVTHEENKYVPDRTPILRDAIANQSFTVQAGSSLWVNRRTAPGVATVMEIAAGEVVYGSRPGANTAGTTLPLNPIESATDVILASTAARPNMLATGTYALNPGLLITFRNPQTSGGRRQEAAQMNNLNSVDRITMQGGSDAIGWRWTDGAHTDDLGSLLKAWDDRVQEILATATRYTTSVKSIVQGVGIASSPVFAFVGATGTWSDNFNGIQTNYPISLTPPTWRRTHDAEDTETLIRAFLQHNPLPPMPAMRFTHTAGANVLELHVLDRIANTETEYFLRRAGSGAPSAAQVKTLYESNGDTNAFTDALNAKLASVPAPPANVSETKVYGLGVPATNGAALWEEIDTSTDTGGSPPNLVQVRQNGNMGVSTSAATAVTANITPSASSSKVLVIVDVTVHINTGGSTAARTFTVQLRRGSTVIETVSASVTGHSAGTVYNPVTFAHLDSPNAATQQTYTVTVSRGSGSAHSDGVQNRHITLWEVKADSGGGEGSGLSEAQVTTIADARAAARYTDAEKAGVASLQKLVAALRRLATVKVSSSTQYSTVLTAQATSTNPLVIVVTDPISGTFDGVTYNWEAGNILYVAAQTNTVLFAIPVNYADIEGRTIVTALTALSGDDRLPASAVQGLPSDIANSPHHTDHLPETGPEGTLYFLTQDQVVPSSEQFWRYTGGRHNQDTGGGNLVPYGGAALLGALYESSAALGTNRSAIFRADGVRAIYGKGHNRQVYMVFDDDVVAAADTIHLRIYQVSRDGRMTPWFNEAELTQESVTGGVRVFAGTLPIADGAETYAFLGLPQAQAFVVRRGSSFLQINSDTNAVEFAASSTTRAKGLYFTGADGVPYLTGVLPNAAVGQVAVKQPDGSWKAGGIWRELADSSPYTILTTDGEFIVEMTAGSSVYNVFAIRAQLGTTVKRIILDSERPDGSHAAELGVNLTLNAAGTELTVVKFQNDSRGASFAITGVYAK